MSDRLRFLGTATTDVPWRTGCEAKMAARSKADCEPDGDLGPGLGLPPTLCFT